MNVLKDKQMRNYTSLSRYANIPYYYNTLDDKYMYGLCQQLSEDSEYSIHTLKPNDTPDSLALYYYGRPDYYWAILDFNRIQDPYIDLYNKFKTIKIPSISYIHFVGDIHSK